MPVITRRRNAMKMLISRQVVTAVCAGCLALLAVACASSSSSTSAPAATTSAPAATTSASAVSTSGPAPAASAVDLKTEHTKLGTVLADDKGLTVYWFARDTSTSSACTGACAVAWPPVIGMPRAAAGFTLTGKFGTVKRGNGTLQATYDGHPLYTFEGDTAPGQTTGNGIIAFGGLWSAIKLSPAGAVTPAASPTKTGGSGGY
jgi:predicted lipoprotein with Yx(FWY)xxD motif